MGIDDGIICGFFCHPDKLGGSRFGQLYSTRCVLVCLSLLVEVVDGLYGKVGETVPDPTLTSPETVKPQPTPPSTLGFEILSLTFSRRHNYICMSLVSKSFSRFISSDFNQSTSEAIKMPDTYDSTGIEYYNIPSFTFISGVTKPIKVAYHSFNPSSRKTALIPTCYAGRINETLNFTSGALKDYHVIVVAMLGNGESSAPSNDPDFPADYSLRYQDCINSQYQLVTDHLGIKSLDAVMGFSMGGQQAYYWAVMHGSGPEPFAKNVIPICGSAKTSGHSK